VPLQTVRQISKYFEAPEGVMSAEEVVQDDELYENLNHIDELSRMILVYFRSPYFYLPLQPSTRCLGTFLAAEETKG